MATGMYRTDDGWVQVNYGAHAAPVPKATYEENGYSPPYDKLPTESAYKEAEKKVNNNAQGS